MTTNQSCEYATITVAGGEVLAGGGCAGKPDGTVCIQCRKDGKPLVGIIPDGGFWYPGSQVNGQVNCKDYIRKDGTCLNGGCQGLVVTGVCKDVLKDDVGPQPVPPG